MRIKKATIQEWVTAVGERPAIGGLVKSGLGPSTAEKIIRGQYSSTFRRRSIEAITKAMAFDGFLFTDVKTPKAS